MNLDEVMTLSDDELRVKAAELAGWEYVEIRDGKLTGTSSDLDDAANWMHIVVPDYPNDIVAAMGLAEEIAHRYWLSLHTPFLAGEPYYAGFTPLGTTGWNGVPDNKCPGDKPGQAITRAFILTMTTENEEV